MSGDFAERLVRVEAVQAIQQLAIRYAIAVDSRDIDAWLRLFPEDVHCGRHGSGRAVLRSLIEPELRSFYRSIHQICGHRIELDGADRAGGIVYCRAEHEVGRSWIVMAIAYFDDYVRIGGDWFFARRKERHWYSADLLDRPAPPFHRWPPDREAAALPGDFETWTRFWDEVGAEAVDDLTAEPVRKRE